MAMIRALNSGVSGIQTHQTKIDVIGNNLANVNTTGFKSGRALFQTLFSQTLSFGSAAQANNCGVNPKQVGLGVEVAQISQNWEQGAIDTTGIPSDLAIEGEGFFIMNDNDGTPVYSRDGAFARNIDNKLVNPSTGFFVQGWNANADFEIMAGGALEDIEVKVGEQRVAQATTTVQLNGNFDSDGNPLADEGSEIVSTNLFILGTSERATAHTDLRSVTMTSGSTTPLVATSNGTGIDGGYVQSYTAGTNVGLETGLTIAAGTTYLLDVAKGVGAGQTIMFDGAAYTSGTGLLDLTHSSVTGDVAAGSFTNAVDTTNGSLSVYTVQTLPSGGITSAVYTPLNLEAKKGGASLQRLEGTTAKDMTFSYNTSGTTVQDLMNWMERTLGVDSSAGETVLSGGIASATTGAAVTPSIVLDDKTAGTFESVTGLSTSDDRYLLKVVDGDGEGQSFIFSPAANYNAATNTITSSSSSPWINALTAAGATASQITIQKMTTPHDGRFSADEAAGGTVIADFVMTGNPATDNTITNTTMKVDPTVLAATIDSDRIHVGDIIRFTGDSGDAQGKIAIITDINRTTGLITFNVDGTASGSGLTDSVGATVTPPLNARFDVLRPTGVGFSADGVMRVDGNLGKFNDITDMVIKDNNNSTLMQFTQSNNAVGESGRTTFTVYDSTGNPKEVSVSFYLESRTDSTTSLRWIAESPNDSDLNKQIIDPSGGTLTDDNGRVIGGGRVVFDDDGQFLSGYPAGSSTVVIDTVASGAGASLSFAMDFSSITSLSNGVTDINMMAQDGMPEGVLESFSVGVDGTVTGIFSNGLTRSVAQVALARFNNNQGLLERGDNLWSVGPNSGNPQVGVAGTDGRGIIRGGALEASNVDLSNEFTDLITTQRGFQASARIVSVADELLQELVNLRR